MASVKMNSPTNNQPATKGSTKKKTKGLITKKVIIANLYHLGEFPKKLCINAWLSDTDDMDSSRTVNDKQPVVAKFKYECLLFI